MTYTSMLGLMQTVQVSRPVLQSAECDTDYCVVITESLITCIKEFPMNEDR
jgi:hypothetical protein